MKSLTLKKTIADALSARRKFILDCKDNQGLTDIADLLNELSDCFRDCESFSMDFVYPDGGKIHV